MTREEAIRIIRKMLACTDLSVRANLNADMVDACHLAIKALEQEPCEDAISRQAALDIYDDYNVAVENGELEAYRKHRKRLLKLPSAHIANGTPLEQEPKEITWEDIKEYCEKRCLTIVTNQLFHELTHHQEPQSFKWCTDCKEYDQEKHCCHRYSKVIRDTVAEIRQEPVLDKVRAEIERQEKWLTIAGYNTYNVDIALDAIKSMVAESEDRE